MSLILPITSGASCTYFPSSYAQFYPLYQRFTSSFRVKLHVAYVKLCAVLSLTTSTFYFIFSRQASRCLRQAMRSSIPYINVLLHLFASSFTLLTSSYTQFYPLHQRFTSSFRVKLHVAYVKLCAVLSLISTFYFIFSRQASRCLRQAMRSSIPYISVLLHLFASSFTLLTSSYAQFYPLYQRFTSSFRVKLHVTYVKLLYFVNGYQHFTF
ncbi:hypothetical protein B0G66_103416 [Bacillus badius]|nr:hypothetical protein B0G66_103416 [Bacillus badius]